MIAGALASPDNEANFPARIDAPFPALRQTKDPMSVNEPMPTAPTVPPNHGFVRRHWGKLTLLILVAAPALVFTIWAGVALNFSYSQGNRVGYVQKLSKKGWLCKTWEGELAQVNMPGAMSQIFVFTVRSDSVAAVIQKLEGGLVALDYAEHRGVPTNCFGETGYFVNGVRRASGH